VQVQDATICQAIRTRVLLEFDYDGRHRVAAPYCHNPDDTAMAEIHCRVERDPIG
jgi:hypothetical protein